MKILAVTEHDRGWIRSFLSERWGSPEIVTRGRLHHASRLPGFIAFDGEYPKGLITYTFENGDCEIVSLDSLESGKGIGSALVKAVSDLASAERCERLWLITTNDNTGALRFYQKIGFELAAIHRNAIKKSREMKPGIPEKGCDGIPIRDEIELEIPIQCIDSLLNSVLPSQLMEKVLGQPIEKPLHPPKNRPMKKTSSKTKNQEAKQFFRFTK